MRPHKDSKSAPAVGRIDTVLAAKLAAVDAIVRVLAPFDGGDRERILQCVTLLLGIR